MIAEVALFPGIVTVVEGVIVKVPVVSVPAQNTPPSQALFRAKGLPSVPPFVAFQETWTFRTVIGSWGFVIEKPIPLLTMVSGPVVILLQPGIAVDVMVGVNVSVGVAVCVEVDVTVAVGVNVGTRVAVLVGKGVNVIIPPRDVAVGVGDGAVAVGVSTGRVLPGVIGIVGTGVFGELDVSKSRST